MVFNTTGIKSWLSFPDSSDFLNSGCDTNSPGIKESVWMQRRKDKT